MISIEKKIYTFFMVVSPILIYYKSPISIFSLDYFCLLIFIFPLGITFFKNIKINNKLIHNYSMFSFWIIFSSLLNTLILGSTLKAAPIIIFIQFLMILIGTCGAFDYEFGINIYNKLAILACVLLLAQVILYNIFGYILNCKIPYLAFLDKENFYTFDPFVTNTYINRYQSFFGEPAHFAQFVLPSLCFNLIKANHGKKTSLLVSLLIIISIFFSTSGIGIAMSILIFSLNFFINDNKKSNKIIAKIALACSIIVVMFIFISKSQNISLAIDRIFAALPSNGGGAANYRVYRGFAYFFELGIPFKIFGIGIGNINFFTDMFHITTLYDLDYVDAAYMNTIANILVTTGIVGLYLLVKMSISLFKQARLYGKYIVLILFCLMITSDIFPGGFWIFYMFLIISSINYQNKELENKPNYLVSNT